MRHSDVAGEVWHVWVLLCQDGPCLDLLQFQQQIGFEALSSCQFFLSDRNAALVANVLREELRGFARDFLGPLYFWLLNGEANGAAEGDRVHRLPNAEGNERALQLERYEQREPDQVRPVLVHVEAGVPLNYNL